MLLTRILSFAVILPIVLTTGVRAQTSSERQTNIIQAAEDIAKIQHDHGANGAFEAINLCYRRELAQAKSLNLGLEACMTQDIIVSRVSAAFYKSLSTDWRTIPGARDPAVILKDMSDRVTQAFTKFNATTPDLVAFNIAVSKLGMAAYNHAAFPDKFPAPTLAQ
jgi:hypothetical protein